MPSSVIELELNGETIEFLAQPGTTLLSALRDNLGLTAAKRGCGVGTCGTCTCHVDGQAVMSCLIPVETINGSTVKTLEGTTPIDGLSKLQQAFLDGFATQCGFCTSGMIMAAEALLAENPDPTREDVVTAISGNVCRCTGYEIDHQRDPRRRRRHEQRFPRRRPPRPAPRRAGPRHRPHAVLRGHDPEGPAASEDAPLRAPPREAASSVDTSAAEAVKGVVKVLTHKDVPNNWYTILKLINVGYDEEPVLPEDQVLYYGEPIVAVVATSERAALEGAAAVKVTYEDLPAVFDVEEAIKPETIAIKPHGTNYFVYEDHHCRRVRFGDVEQGFAEADHIFEFNYQSRPIEQAPTETTGCIVEPQHDGRLKITSDTQACFFTLDNTALILDVPFGKLQVVGGTVGGGFGGKVDVIVEPIACIAAMATNRPVKYVYDRYEEMQVSSPRAAEKIYIKDGVMNDGRIVARKVTLYADAGAYSRHSPYAATKAAAHMPGPYTIPNVWSTPGASTPTARRRPPCAASA